MLTGVASTALAHQETTSPPTGDKLDDPDALDARPTAPRGVRCGRRQATALTSPSDVSLLQPVSAAWVDSSGCGATDTAQDPTRP